MNLNHHIEKRHHVHVPSSSRTPTEDGGVLWWANGGNKKDSRASYSLSGVPKFKTIRRHHISYLGFGRPISIHEARTHFELNLISYTGRRLSLANEILSV